MAAYESPYPEWCGRLRARLQFANSLLEEAVKSPPNDQRKSSILVSVLLSRTLLREIEEWEERTCPEPFGAEQVREDGDHAE